MQSFKLIGSTHDGVLNQIQDIFGGEITEIWGEEILEIDNEKAKGNIKLMAFDSGVNLLQFKISFFQETEWVIDSSTFNAIHFIYITNGFINLKFDNKKTYRTIHNYEPTIIAGKSEGSVYVNFSKDQDVNFTLIQVNRLKFIKKRLPYSAVLNKQIFDVLSDKQHKGIHVYKGSYNLQLSKLINKMDSAKQNGIMRMMIIEGLVIQVLALMISHFINDVKTKKEKKPLSKKELKAIKKVSSLILKNSSKNYTVKDLAIKSGLSQAKLQEGFKYLFSKTVIQYVRHVRLEKAKDLIVNSNLNISQIVYTVGFSSRSYFTKIFKDKYGIRPSEFLKNKRQLNKMNLQ